MRMEYETGKPKWARKATIMFAVLLVLVVLSGACRKRTVVPEGIVAKLNTSGFTRQGIQDVSAAPSAPKAPVQ